MPSTSPLAARLLLVDPDPATRALAAACLRRHGHQIDERPVADDVAVAAQRGYHLVLMDPGAPAGRGARHGDDAWQRLRQLREHHQRLPVILMQHGAGSADRTVALELGADAVLDKPLDPLELQARVHALLRRQREDAGQRALQFGGWRLDPSRRSLVLPGGAEVALSPAECRLLRSFLTRPRHPFSRSELLDLARGNGVQQLDRSIDLLVSRLRHKLGEATPGPIRTVRGVGYLFEALDAGPLGPARCQGSNPDDVSA